MKIRIGIDVGKNGGIAAIYEDGTIKFHKTPLVAKEIDTPALKQQITDLIDEAKKDGKIADVMIAIEAVQNIAKVGSKSNFQFGRALGILEGLVTGMGLPFLKVHPKKWQNHCFLGIPVVYVAGSEKVNKKGETTRKVDTKAMALLAAKRLYPNTSFKATERSKVDHDGIVDALMIARYIKDHF